jgi:hypothetical protein
METLGLATFLNARPHQQIYSWRTGRRLKGRNSPALLPPTRPWGDTGRGRRCIGTTWLLRYVHPTWRRGALARQEERIQRRSWSTFLR